MSLHRLCPRLFLLTASLAAVLPCTSLAAPTPPDAQQPQIGQSPTEKPQQAFSIPFTPLPKHGGPLLHLRINGQEDAAFIADTGAGGNLITQSMVAKLGLKTRPALGNDGKPYQMFGAPLAFVDVTKLTFSTVNGAATGKLDANLTDAPFVVSTREQLGIEPGFPFDGFLGAPFFRVWAVAFDFPAHAMGILYPGGLSPSQVKALGFGGKGGAVLSLSPCEGECFSVTAVLSNGRSARRVELEVDTGAGSTLIPLETAKALSLKFLGTGKIAGGTAGHKVLGRAQLPSLSLGNIRLANMTVLATDNLATPTVIPVKNDPMPRLGMDILKNYRVLIDRPAKLMYIQPVATSKK